MVSFRFEATRPNPSIVIRVSGTLNIHTLAQTVAMNLAGCKDKLIILLTFLASFLVTNIIVVLFSKISLNSSKNNQRNKFLIKDWTKVEDEMYGVVGGHYDLIGRLEAEKICAENNARY